ncbi:MAG TPA: hypothetical protein VHV77_03070 [Pirellulales bacterium]|nr:hypothetical protein [Pirellulales bacterium]
MQELVDLGFDGTWFLGHAPVDEFADNDFPIKGIASSMPGLGFRGGRDCRVEAWVAATIGAKRDQRLAEILLNVAAATAHVVVQRFVDKLVHGPFEHLAQRFKAVLQRGLQAHSGGFFRHGWYPKPVGD